MTRPKDRKNYDGLKAAAELLNQLDPAHRDKLLSELANRDPATAEAIQDRMFTFEDIARLDDRSLQILFHEVKCENLALALRKASAEFKALVFKNIPERAGELLREEMESSGPRKVSDVRAAQKALVELVRRMIAEGRLKPAER